jgi:hypothetical protein
VEGGEEGHVQGREVTEEVNDKGRERRTKEKNEVAKEKKGDNNKEEENAYTSL